MLFYAQLDEGNICVGISQLNGEVDNPDMIQVEKYDADYLNRKRDNGKWSEDKFLPEQLEPESTPEEIMLQKLEQLEQDALIKSELDLERDLMIMEMAMSLQI